MVVAAVQASVGYTYDFVRGSLPSAAARVVEIGCGSGELAKLLMADGLQVMALDADPECVASAQAIGVDARHMVWPAPLDERFDAVLFTRSLHHVRELGASVAAARAVLRPGGRIIVEDFRAEGGGDRSARWFAGLARLLVASGALTHDAAVEELIRNAAPSSIDHHHLHSSDDIAAALGSLKAREDAAYYFRYFEPYLREQSAGQELLAHELDLIVAGSIDALGKRFVAEVD